MRKRRMLGVPALALVGALLGAACGSDSGSSGGGGSAGGGDAGGGAGSALTIENFAFDPNTLSGGAGEALAITVTNGDGVEHSFTLDDGAVSQDIESGETETVTVTLPQSGSLGWHCKYHPQMTGTLEVA